MNQSWILPNKNFAIDSRLIWAYSPAVFAVRRLSSISAALALLLSMAMPHMAMTCHTNRSMRMCHRAAGEMRHCDMAMREDVDTEMAVSDDDSGSTITAAAADPGCPMNCCFQSNSGHQVAVALDNNGFHTVQTDLLPRPNQRVFISNGFSSHTDRGPPSSHIG